MMFGKPLLYCAAFVIACVVFAQTVAHHPKHEPQTPKPERIFAPYIDMGVLPNDLVQIQRDSGIHVFTLAFINAGHGCNPSWPEQPIASDDVFPGYVKKLRAAGGDIIIAFGGYEETELAVACHDIPSLQAAYQQVVNKYGAKTLDFDIEHLAIGDQPSIDRRNIALKNLAQTNPGLQINYTLPAIPTGLTDEAVNVLKSAVTQGTPIHLVNVMVMNYGLAAPSKDMGANAVSAIDGAQQQLKTLGLNAKLGITPMIGVNDARHETFTLSDAASVLSYAQKNQNVALLAFWSVARDNGSCTAKVATNCSGIPQKPWDFSHIFAGFQ